MRHAIRTVRRGKLSSPCKAENLDLSCGPLAMGPLCPLFLNRISKALDDRDCLMNVCDGCVLNMSAMTALCGTDSLGEKGPPPPPRHRPQPSAYCSEAGLGGGEEPGVCSPPAR